MRGDSKKIAGKERDNKGERDDGWDYARWKRE